MSEKILILDGHSILNRAFYGLPDLTNAEGLHTNAVYGFLNIMLKVMEEEKPEYLAVAFDVHAPTFRHRMYPEYKGTRHPMPEELREQVPLMQKVLRAMGVELLMLEGYEADDLIGTAARRSEAKGLEVTVLSGDRDLLQLASDNILIRIPKTKGGQTQILNYHTAEVMEEYGLTPPQIIELKALMGDSADNIPGIPGVGVKTATKILQQYETIENAHAHVEEIKPKKAMESMRDHWDLAVLSKTLATINTDSPVVLDYEKAKIGNLFTPEAYELYKNLGFKNLLKHFEASEVQKKEKIQVQILSELADAELLPKKAAEAGTVGLYILHDFDPLQQKAEIAGIAAAFSAEEIRYLPAEGFMTGSYLAELAVRIVEAAEETAVYDLKSMLKAAEIPEKNGTTDITIAAYLLNPLTAEYPYDTLAGKYIPDRLILSAEELFGGKKLPKTADMDKEKAALYAGQIAFTALAAAGPMKKELEEEQMLGLLKEMEMPLIFTLHHMEQAGIRVLPEELESYGRNLVGSIDTLEKRIWEQAGEEFNINSPKQLGVILFEKMQLPGGKKTKTGYSTAADVLEKLAADVPMVAEILEYRQLTKLKSTYADGLAAFIAADGRIHSNFKQTITATGRISSADPNLQNIPVRMELGRQIRKVFVPQEGYVFVDADYSQIELRVLASMSGDEKLIAAYREAKDIHRITASQVFHVPFEEVTSLQRRNAKAVNFGIVYGISAFGLAQDLDISRKEAQEYIDSYYETYPAIQSFLDGLVDTAKETGYSVSLYGRKRPMPELKSGNFMQRSFGERVARNAPIQGTAADIIKIAMNAVDRRLRKENLKSRLLLQVHDELLIETAADEVEQVHRILYEEMTGAADLAVKLEIDAHDGKNWYEAK
ncbi:MAG: DNA polymerase I [Eubacteriales bacterium]|nr:DNA polymerase I [Eubacteriales bacterium]